MLDFSFGEIALIALVALLVVGPRDLPKLLRSAGHALGKLKSVSDEFRAGVKSAMKETALQDIHAEMRALDKDVKYIKDERGNLQQVYDISDFLNKDGTSQTPLPSSTPSDTTTK